MFNNDTPASATGAAGIKKQTLFGPQSTSNTSGTFTVGPEPFYIRAFNLNVGDTITVQAVGGTGSGTAFATYAPLGSPIVLNQSTPQVRLDWPGAYRVVFSGVSVTSILCEGFNAVSSEPTIYTQGTGGGSGGGFNLVASDTQSIDLNFVGTSAGGTLTGNAKISVAANNLLQSTLGGLYCTTLINTSSNITVTGNGSTGTPYIIGANLTVLPFPDLSPAPAGLVSGPALSVVLFCVDTPFEHCDLYGGERSSNSLGETCVGFGAGPVAGGFKVAVGHSAMSGATTSAAGGFLYDVAVGRQAMVSAHRNTSLSSAATCVGANSGDSMQYSQAVAIGNIAARNTNSLSIVAVGVAAGDGSIGDANTFVGNAAGGAGRTTSSSVYIGDQAGSGASSAAGAVMIGANAGVNAATGSKDNCIFIGANAGHLGSHIDVIVIGSSTSGNINATADHQIILGTSSHTELRTAGSIIAGGVISASDARLKDNVVTIGNALDTVDRLRPVYFHWDQQALDNAKLPYRAVDCGKNTSGFIAQEINEVIPEVVDVMMGGDGVAYNYVHYDRLIGLAFAAVKELSAQNKALAARITELESKGA